MGILPPTSFSFFFLVIVYCTFHGIQMEDLCRISLGRLFSVGSALL